MRPMPPDVRAAFDAFPPAARHRLRDVRAMIFAAAGADSRIGPIAETLKWGEPAYLTEETRSGSTIRLGWPKGDPGRAAIYFNCRTSLVGDFRTLFGNAFVYEGNRAVLLPVEADFDREALKAMLGMALTYHAAKRRGEAWTA